MMMDNKEIVISVDNVKKSFKIYYDKGYDLKEKIIFKKRNRYEIHDVLKGISFDIHKGEAVGLIGINGCGKSTTLKMLSRIMYPDEGTITINGKVSALIELGAGFHPDMSGRENIYTNASIFGFTKREIDECIEDIIAFSELGEYIDNPVRTYSSGMYMRLAFSVAINVKADILLVDEILAVGDAAFQAKCFSKLREIKANGTTIVIVSHSLGQIEQICDKSIWIKDGLVENIGEPLDVHPHYLEYMGERTKKNIQKESKDKNENSRKDNIDPHEKKEIDEVNKDGIKVRWGSGEARIKQVILTNQNGEESDSFITDEDIDIKIIFEAYKDLEMPVVGIGVFRADGVQCYGTNTQIDRKKLHFLKGIHTVVCKLKSIRLLPGEYSLDIAIHDESGFNYDYYRFVKKFRMCSVIPDVGVCRIEHCWKID